MGGAVRLHGLAALLFRDADTVTMEQITVSVIEVRKGARSDFVIELDPPADDDLTTGSFQVARNFGDSDLLLDLSDADVDVDFTDPNITAITIAIGATALASVNVPADGMVCAALLKLQNPLDAESVQAFQIPFKILPDV